MDNSYLFLHPEWTDVCILENNNLIKRTNIENEYGSYKIEKYKITIKWNNWPNENLFILNKEDKSYYEEEFYNNYINNYSLKNIDLIHNEWNDTCILNNNLKIIFKKNDIREMGNFYFENNNLIIDWSNWGKETFIYFDNKYYEKNYDIEKVKLEQKLEKERFENKKIINEKLEKEKLKIIGKQKFKHINNEYFSTTYLEKNKDEKDEKNEKDEKDEKDNVNIYTKYYIHNFELNNSKSDITSKISKLKFNYVNLDNIINKKEQFHFSQNEIMNLFFSLELPFIINEKKGKRSITLVEWGYPPFGGGENWMLTFNNILHKNNYDTYLLCFSDPFKKEYFTEMKLIELEYVKIIQIPKDIMLIIKLVKLINPDFINHQGINRLYFLKIANLLNIPFLTGFCFWDDIVIMDNPNMNIDMMNNKKLKPSENFKHILENSYTYVASKFVNEIINKIYNINLDVIETISSKEEYLVDFDFNDIKKFNERKYVTLINCHYNKGGYLLKYLCQNLDPNIALQFVYTEHDGNITIDFIQECINERNEINNINILIPQKINIKDIYKNTRIILIPSLCDETFCRVGYEAMSNKIPIISTKSGNLKYLLNGYAIFIDNINLLDWKNNIENLYFIKEKIYNFSTASKRVFSDDEYTGKYINNINDKIIEKKIMKKLETINESKYKNNSNNIGIIIPWVDQGLGIQGREYYINLKELGYEPYIFSFKPYHGNKINNYLQNYKSEWDYENVTYSKNYREDIKYEEILDFIYQNKIKKVIIIEANLIHIFNIVALLKILNIEVYIVVNIECININELKYHNLFNKIITNNNSSKIIISQIYENKTEYLGFHLNHPYFKENIKKDIVDFKNLKFCCIGGLNSISRKNIDKIIQFFYSLYEENIFINWTLNIYIQDVEIPEIIKKYKCDKINYIIKYLSYKEIISNLVKNDIFIHLGNQEGLGIGFYESLYCGTPIISLNWYPNNEIITDNVNGWLIDCKYDNINEKCLINKGIVDSENIKNKIIKIMYDISSTEKIIKNTLKNKEELFNENKKKFFENFKKILN